MGSLAGIGKLIRLALRRDRIKLPLTVAIFGLLFYGLTAGVVSVYGESDSERQMYAATSAVSPVAKAFNGPVLGASIESVAFTETFTFLTIFVALVTTLLVVRHTRQNEETGRAELVGAAVVGRYAPVTAALVVAIVMNLAIGVLAALGYIANGLPAEGSLLTGAATAMVGIIFAAIAAVAAQLTTTARAANGLASAAIGVAFLVRAIGDMQGQAQPDGLSAQSGWLAWLSPIGIARNTRPYADNEWWILLLLLAITAAIIGGAYWLASRRDLGAGLIAPRSGRAAAAKGLLSSLGLAWRLQRGVLTAWAIALAIFAAALGAVANEVGSFTGGNAESSQIVAMLGGSGDIIKSYLAFSLLIFGVAVIAYAIQALLRLRAEETSGHLELVLATGVHREAVVATHFVVVSAGAALLLAICGAFTGMAYGATIGDIWGQFGELLAASLAYMPVVLLFAAFTVAAFGLLPSVAIGISWAVFVLSYLIVQFARLLNLPQWLVDLSPINYVPRMPVEPFEAAPLLIITGIAALIAAGATIGFRKRNITTA